MIYLTFDLKCNLVVQVVRLYVYLNVTKIMNFMNVFYSSFNCGGGAMGCSVSIACGRLGVRIPATTDPSRKNSSTAKRSAIECHGSLEMTIINGYPVSQTVWHAIKNPHGSMVMSAEHRLIHR